MGELVKRLEQAQPINDEKANKLAGWFREHQEDLLYLIKQGFQVRKIQGKNVLSDSAKIEFGNSGFNAEDNLLFYYSPLLLIPLLEYLFQY